MGILFMKLCSKRKSRVSLSETIVTCVRCAKLVYKSQQTRTYSHYTVYG